GGGSGAKTAAFAPAGHALASFNVPHPLPLPPIVLRVLMERARRYRPPGVRVPFERGVPPYRHALLGATMMPWALRAQRRLRRAGVAPNGAPFRGFDTGSLTGGAASRNGPRSRRGPRGGCGDPAPRAGPAD